MATSLDVYSQARHFQKCSSLEEVEQPMGESGIVPLRMALLSKLKSDGVSWKYRIIWGWLRSGTNDSETAPGRAIYPRYGDTVEDVRSVGADCQPGTDSRNSHWQFLGCLSQYLRH
jgi:hypothetical protein